jgi:hypothetical protein
MPLNHYKQDGKLTIGSYFPSENWSAYTHFGVMDKENQSLIASVGYFTKITPNMEPVVFEEEDYLEAATQIEQGQLYAAAPVMFELLEDIFNEMSQDHYDDPETREELQARLDLISDTLASVTDIREPVTRLLGPQAMKIIGIAKQKQTGAPMVTRISGQVLGSDGVGGKVVKMEDDKLKNRLPRKKR